MAIKVETVNRGFILLIFIVGLTKLIASEGTDLFESGNYKEAYKVLEGELNQSSSNKTLNFYFGRSAFKLGKYKEASAAFERILIVDENNQRARLELARAYLALNMYEASQAEFNTVLESNPPEGVRKNIEAFLRIIEERKKSQRYFVYLALGAGYDSNINSSPAKDDYPASEFLSSSSEPISTTFLTETVFVHDELYLNREKSLSWTNTLTLFNQNNSHNKEDEKYDTLYGKFATGIVYRSKNFMVKAPLFYSDLTYGGAHLMNSYGVAPEFLFPKVAGVFVTIGGELKYKRYDRAEADKRDADYTHYYLLLNKNLKKQSFGAKALKGKNRHKVDNEEEYIDNSILLVSGFYQISLYGQTVKLTLSNTTTTYDDYVGTTGEKREDKLESIGLNVSRKITKEMAVALNLQKSKSSSNYTAGKYSKDLIGVNLSYSFGGGK